MAVFHSLKMGFMGVGVGSLYYYWVMHKKTADQLKAYKSEFANQRDLIYMLKLKEFKKESTQLSKLVDDKARL